MWEESVGEWGPGLLDALSGIEDPRKPRGVRHPLSAVLALSVCAMPSGARSLYAIAQWGREHPQFAQPLGFSRERTPCVATLHHVFRRLDADAFESAQGRWAQECLGEGEATIAIDGKALRGIHGGELPGVRLVAAYSQESGLVLGQEGGRGNARRVNWGCLRPAGPTGVAGDALYAQRELSLRVLEQGGDYFWVIKDNQLRVKEEASLLIEQPP